MSAGITESKSGTANSLSTPGSCINCLSTNTSLACWDVFWRVDDRVHHRQGSGLPLAVYPADACSNGVYGGGQAFGEADAANFGALLEFRQHVRIKRFPQFETQQSCSIGSLSRYGPTGYGPSLLADPQAAYLCFRNPSRID